MKPKGHWVGPGMSILAFVLGACSAAPTPSGGGDSAVETRVAGTLAALTPGVSTETPPATELPGTEAPTAVEGTPSADGICEVVTNGLNLRDGPGTGAQRRQCQNHCAPRPDTLHPILLMCDLPFIHW